MNVAIKDEDVASAIHVKPYLTFIDRCIMVPTSLINFVDSINFYIISCLQFTSFIYFFFSSVVCVCCICVFSPGLVFY